MENKSKSPKQNKRLIGRYKFLMLDGYNVIHAIERYKSLSRESLESARYALLDDLVDYQAFTGDAVVVVFDAYTSKGKKIKREMFKGVVVIYTKEHQTADSYIESEAERLVQDPKHLVRVVTSDWAEQQLVMGSGAVRMTPREFHFELERVRLAIQERLPKQIKTGESIETQLSSEAKALLNAIRKGNSS
jgi:uncharacterized protein